MAAPDPRQLASARCWSTSATDRVVVAAATGPRSATRSTSTWSTSCTPSARDLEQHPAVLILAGSRTGSSPPARTSPSCASAAATTRCAGINSTLFVRIAKLPMPVIAALDGYALGGGAELAYAADFRIGTPALKIGNPETGLGIIAAAGATWRLKELVGEPLAKEILLAGRVLTRRGGPRRAT